MAMVTRNKEKALRLAERDVAALVISVGPEKGAANVRTKKRNIAEIGIGVASTALASELERAIARALDDVANASLPKPRIVRVVSRKALDRIGAAIEGAFVIVPVSSKNLRHAQEIVDGARRARAVGIQLAWDGKNPPHENAEPKIFAILERARATPSDPPVVLSRSENLVEALRILARPKSVK